MITVNNYIVEYDETLGAYKIQSAEAPVCPVCGQLLSGYDRRARHIIDSLGNVHWFSLRRLRCNNCKKLHLELPDFMRPISFNPLLATSSLLSAYFLPDYSSGLLSSLFSIKQ